MRDKVEIVYVEDNEDYVGFVKNAMNRIDDNLELHTLTTGNQALDFFTSHDKDHQPAMILLDVDLPGINGIELVRLIRLKKDMAFIPVIMFSTSDNPADVKAAYENGANAYVVKPSSLKPLVNSLRSICDFWLGYNFDEKLHN